MRRQKCDRKQPCSRCVQADETDSCTRVWDGGYDARTHRAYPRAAFHQGTPGPRTPTARPPKTTSPYQSLADHGRQTNHPGSASSRARSTSVEGNNGVLITGIHPEENPLRSEEDVREFDYYARFRHNEVFYLQSCLPNHVLLYQLVEYHEQYLLWHHNCLHGPTFREEVLNVFHSAGNNSIRLKNLDLRWCALLFAVLTASLTCATEDQAQKWNMNREQKQHCSKKWHEAAMECLVLGEFASKPHVYSIQTIQVLNLSALALGLSNQQFVMFGTALRIAQSLGLQRLPYELENGTAEMSEAVRLQREIGRRIWYNLVMQDWFSISTHDMFSIHPHQFTTPRPRRHTEEGSDTAQDEALIDYTNCVLDVATVMVEFHMASIACAETEAKYEQVLKHDARLRRLGSRVVSPNSREIGWIPWARGVFRVMNAHKIIILHRHFLGRSFRDEAFAYTRWASVEASKLIIREVEQSFAYPERPSIWNDQAHLTGAGVTLCLDVMHRNESDMEHAEHRKLVDKVMFMLAECRNSVLASRGHRLLSSMLKESVKNPPAKSTADNTQAASHIDKNNESESLSWPIENRETIDTVRTIAKPNEGAVIGHPTPTSQGDSQSPAKYQTQSAQRPPAMTADPIPDGSIGAYDFQFPAATDDVLADASWTDMLSEFFPDQLGFGNALAFDDFLNSHFPT